jgi:hypothetical protein
LIEPSEAWNVSHTWPGVLKPGPVAMWGWSLTFREWGEASKVVSDVKVTPPSVLSATAASFFVESKVLRNRFPNRSNARLGSPKPGTSTPNPSVMFLVVQVLPPSKL